VGCCIWRFKMDRNRAIAPGIIKFVATIRDKDQVNAKLASGSVKAARLVAQFCGEEEESRHLYI
jgi:hypothetical protein